MAVQSKRLDHGIDRSLLVALFQIRERGFGTVAWSTPPPVKGVPGCWVAKSPTSRIAVVWLCQSYLHTWGMTGGSLRHAQAVCCGSQYLRHRDKPSSSFAPRAKCAHAKKALTREPFSCINVHSTLPGARAVGHYRAILMGENASPPALMLVRGASKPAARQ